MSKNKKASITQTPKELHFQLLNFLHRIEAINDALPMTMLLLGPYHSDAFKELEKYEKAKKKESKDNSVSIKFNEISYYEQLQKNAHSSALASKLIPESLFVSMLSQFDAYIGFIIRFVINMNPSLLNNSEKNISFSQIFEMGSIEEAKEFMIQKELDIILRKSHKDHLEYLDKRIGTSFTKDIVKLDDFIEISERRNLVVHCDGIVSKQYIANCSKYQSKNKLKLGEQVNISPKYFNHAFEILFDVATRIAHVLWRKFFKDDLENADCAINELCFDLLCNKEFVLAESLTNFALSQSKHYNDKIKCMITINAALSKYLSKDKDGACKILDSKDWSSANTDLRLASCVIREEYDKVFILMKEIGTGGDIEKEGYQEWPLFYQVRKSKGFRDTFKQIFNEDYTILEKPKNPIINIIENNYSEHLSKKAVNQKNKKETLLN